MRIVILIIIIALIGIFADIFGFLLDLTIPVFNHLFNNETSVIMSLFLFGLPTILLILTLLRKIYPGIIRSKNKQTNKTENSSEDITIPILLLLLFASIINWED